MSTFEIVQGIEGACLLLDDVRIAGPKAWGGGKVVMRFDTDDDYVVERTCHNIEEPDTIRNELMDNGVLRGGQMSELLPCPFCGCPDIGEYEGDYGNGVYCMNCGAMMGEPIHLEFRVDKRVTYDEAISAWNTRAERTCHVVSTSERLRIGGHVGLEYVTKLSCGHFYHDTYGEAPNCCPNCGAKVVDE